MDAPPTKKITEIAMGPVICKIRNQCNGVPLSRAITSITRGRNLSRSAP